MVRAVAGHSAGGAAAIAAMPADSRVRAGIDMDGAKAASAGTRRGAVHGQSRLHPAASHAARSAGRQPAEEMTDQRETARTRPSRPPDATISQNLLVITQLPVGAVGWSSA